MKSGGIFDGLLDSLRSMLEIIVVVVFVITFLVQPFRIPSESMEPTLLVGDFLLVDTAAFSSNGHFAALLPSTTVRRGDLVVFHYPVDSSRDLVKRVVGVPGDRIRLRAGQVFIDGNPLPEPYAFYSPSRPNGFRDDFPNLREADPDVDPRWWVQLRRSMVDTEIVVPQGHYFVMGDNRNDSLDSRYWGFVPQQNMIGRPLLVYFSLAPAAKPAAEHGIGQDFRTLWHNMRVLR